MLSQSGIHLERLTFQYTILLFCVTDMVEKANPGRNIDDLLDTRSGLAVEIQRDLYFGFIGLAGDGCLSSHWCDMSL